MGRVHELVFFQGETMFRKVIGALVLGVLCGGIAFAEEIRGVIFKVDGDKVTFAKSEKKGETGDKKVYDAKGAKVVKGVFNKDTKKLEAGDAIEGGLQATQLKDIGEKGVRATIDADGDKIKQIILFGGKKAAN